MISKKKLRNSRISKKSLKHISRSTNNGRTMNLINLSWNVRDTINLKKIAKYRIYWKVKIFHNFVYFCYGRLSNRMLLMRYGISLPHNKYDHVYIKIEYLYELKNYRIINEKLMTWKNISKYKKFKIKRTVFCLDFILFLRAKHWKLKVGNNKCLDSLFWLEDVEFEIKILS